jgi:hypothetical protein
MWCFVLENEFSEMLHVHSQYLEINGGNPERGNEMRQGRLKCYCSGTLEFAQLVSLRNSISSLAMQLPRIQRMQLPQHYTVSFLLYLDKSRAGVQLSRENSGETRLYYLFIK